ncbi:long chain base biosynthesis protein 2a [Tanacetum coccineum]
MEKANLPPTNNRPVLPVALRTQAVQELYELQRISAFTNMNDLESDDESVDTPLVSPFPHSDNDLDDGEVLNELIEYEMLECYAEKKRQLIVFKWG